MTAIPVPVSPRVYKFIVDDDHYYPLLSNPKLSYRTCGTATIAGSLEEARMNLARYASENGLDAKWLEIARVVEIPLVSGAVLMWFME